MEHVSLTGQQVGDAELGSALSVSFRAASISGASSRGYNNVYEPFERGRFLGDQADVDTEIIERAE